MSDWAATHSGYPAADAGLDMDMPGGISFLTATPSYFGGNITTSVNNGSLALDRLDDMCRRIMTPYFHLGQDQNYPPIDGAAYTQTFFPRANYVYNFTEGPANVDVRDDHAQLIREIGAAGIVLLKNVNNTLPLKTPADVGVFGNDAPDISAGLYSIAIPGLGPFGYDQGVLPVGGGSGTGRLTYVVPPLEAVKTQVFSYNDRALVQYVTNNSEIISSNIFGPLIYPTPPEVCLVFLKTWATEGNDRTSLLVDWEGTEVVEAVAASCPNTVVITHSGGLNTLPFADNPNVTAILAAHLGGQEVGNSIVDVLWGKVNPSGKLPYTIALDEGDYAFADITNSTELLETTDPNAWQSDFEERLLIDYRHFDYFNESVQYEFGYGLSYTTFSMGSASVARVGSGSISSLPTNNTIVPGGNPALWDVLYSVSVSVSNTGSVAGATVPQLYLGLPQPANEDYTPVKVLRGFEKVTLQPGKSQTVTFDLTRRDISYWDTLTQQWTIGASSIGVLAGFSSRDIQSTTSFSPLASSSSGGSASATSSGGSASPTPTGYGSGGHGDHSGPWHWASSQDHASHWGPPAAK
ncbi:hypothetical protein LTR53_004804 [Teratosphaeriaceae sp. CCFEE 6253]|nr:hypothetical protein LTR53_004804 [Teratosphaeriaceae sp. CCFEE 6253]